MIMRNTVAIVFAFCGMLLAGPGSVYSQETSVKTRIGELRFTHDFANGYPTNETRNVRGQPTEARFPPASR